jgi:hypothetical protein
MFAVGRPAYILPLEPGGWLLIAISFSEPPLEAGVFVFQKFAGKKASFFTHPFWGNNFTRQTAFATNMTKTHRGFYGFYQKKTSSKSPPLRGQRFRF